MTASYVLYSEYKNIIHTYLCVYSQVEKGYALNR